MPSEETQFPKGTSGNPGGRTPARWLRDLLDAAYDKSEPGVTKRQKIGEHLIEIATKWEIIHLGRNYEVASGRDAVEAAKLLLSYDMGKPVNSVEVTGANGGPIASVVATQTTAELREMIAVMLGLSPTAELPPQVLDGSESKAEQPK
jgi:hypothetical protein